MRNLIIGAAALLAVAVPSMASADTGGGIELTYAGIDDSAAGSKDNVVALSGVVITDMEHTGWRLQFNATGADVDTYGTSFSYSQAEVHATYDMGQFEVGVFTGMLGTNGWGWWEYGVEGAMNFERGRVAVSVAGANSNNANWDDISSIAATGSFKLTDDIHIGASLSSTDYGNYGSGDNVDSWEVSVGYEIPNTNFGIGIGYRSSEFDSRDVDFVGVALSWNFGGGAHGRSMPGAMAFVPDAISEE